MLPLDLPFKRWPILQLHIVGGGFTLHKDFVVEKPTRVIDQPYTLTVPIEAVRVEMNKKKNLGIKY